MRDRVPPVLAPTGHRDRDGHDRGAVSGSIRAPVGLVDVGPREYRKRCAARDRSCSVLVGRSPRPVCQSHAALKRAAAALLLCVCAAAAPAVEATELCPIGENDLSEQTEWTSTYGCTHRDGHFVTGLEGIRTVPFGICGIRGLCFGTPQHDLPVVACHVKRQQTVGIGPEPSLHNPL